MKCHNCGANLQQNASFCGNCGTAVSRPRMSVDEQQYFGMPDGQPEGASTYHGNSQPEGNESTYQDMPQQGGYEITYQDSPQQGGYEVTYQGGSQQTVFGDFSDKTTSVGFIEAVRRFFAHYGDFNGRASRTEFWWSILFIALVMPLVMCIPGVNILLALALTYPYLAIGARRLHDMGLSGKFMLLLLLSGIGNIVLIALWCMPSVEDNRWGPCVRLE